MRGGDHLSDLGNRREGKPLWQHAQEVHLGVLKEEDWKMKVLRKFKTPLERQISEALEIERRSWSADELLNKKGQWNCTKLPRLRLESQDETREQVEDKVRSKTEEVDRKKRLRVE